MTNPQTISLWLSFGGYYATDDTGKIEEQEVHARLFIQINHEPLRLIVKIFPIEDVAGLHARDILKQNRDLLVEFWQHEVSRDFTDPLIISTIHHGLQNLTELNRKHNPLVCEVNQNDVPVSHQ